MKPNVGLIDKVARSVLALALAVLACRYSYWLLVLAVLLQYTVITSYCMPYRWLGISTAKKK